MPLFNKKLDLKPIPPRSGRCNIGVPAVNEDIDDFKQISLNLSNKELRFIDGIWIHSSRKGDTDDDISRLNQKVKQLEQENSMCHLKIEVLLDLLAEHASKLSALKRTEES